LVAGEHPPDRLAQLAGDDDRGDLAATLPAQPNAHALGELAIAGVVTDRVVRGLDQRPAQIRRALLTEAPAPVDLARLAHPRAKARVADQLRRRAETPDLAQLGSDRVAQHPGDPGAGSQQPHVAVIGPKPTQRPLLRDDLLVEDLDQSAARL